MKPRNTLVSVAPINQSEKKVGNIVIPGNRNREYKQAEVIEVGPGMVTEENELATTRDLRPGQVVLVKTHNRRPTSANGGVLEPVGVDFKTDDNRDLVLVEQSQIVAILQEPEDREPGDTSPIQLAR